MLSHRSHRHVRLALGGARNQQADIRVFLWVCYVHEYVACAHGGGDGAQ